MSHYFNKKELTQQHIASWDSYVSNYEKVLVFNLDYELKDISEKDKIKLLKIHGETDFTKLKEKMINSKKEMGNLQGYEKSALFYRLMSGEKAFLYPVPLSYSYPDYDIMESNTPRELNIESFKMSELIVKQKGVKFIIINQCMWKVLSHNKDQAQITFGEWEKLGFIWTIKLKVIKAEDSKKSIIAHHNPDLSKITKYDELLKEASYQVRNRLHSIVMNLDIKEAMKRQEEYKKYEGFATILYDQEMLRGKELLIERRKNQLSDYPTEEEITEMINKEIPKYLQNDYFAVKNELYLKTWFIEKTAPKKMKDEYYINT